MKKVLSHTIFSFFIAMTIFTQIEAVESPHLKLVSSAMSVYPGNEFNLLIDIDNNPGICGLTFDLNFNDGLEVIDYTVSSDFLSLNPELTKKPVHFNLIAAGLEDVTVDGVVLTLKFTVKADAKGKQEIKLSNISASDINDGTPLFSSTPITVTVSTAETKKDTPIVTAPTDETTTNTPGNNSSSDSQSDSSSSSASVPTAAKSPEIIVKGADVSFIKKGMTVFDTTFNLSPKLEVDSPLKVEINIEELSNAQKKSLCAVAYNAGNVSKRLGGELCADKKSFVFYAEKFGDTIYTVESIPTLMKIKLQIGQKTFIVSNTSESILDVAPYIEASVGRTMVPLRFITESLDAKVDWETYNETECKVFITIGGKTITIITGQELGKDSKGNSLGTAVLDAKSNRTFVPLRYIAEQFEANVVWVADTKEVFIYK